MGIIEYSIKLFELNRERKVLMINTGIYYQNKISKYDKCVIILFAMLPILDIYCMPSFGVLSIGEIVLLGIIMTTLIKDTRITIPKEAPFLAFYCFAVITTVLSLVFYTNYSYAASAIRLFRDLVYILSFTIIFKRHFNIQFFWNIYKKIVYILGMVFLFQFVFYYITGRHITLYLPFLKLNYAETSPIVLALQRVNMNRMESIFLEPASLVAYFVPVIVMALFAFEREDYKIAIFSSIILFLAKS